MKKILLSNPSIKTIIDKNINKNKPFSFYIKQEGKIATFLPIKNIQNKYCGYFIVYSKNEAIKKELDNLYPNYLIVSLILLLIFILIYKDIIDREKLNKKIDDRTKELQEINKTLKEKVFA